MRLKYILRYLMRFILLKQHRLVSIFNFRLHGLVLEFLSLSPTKECWKIQSSLEILREVLL